MADTEAAPAPASTPKKAKSSKPKKPRTAPSHPKVSDMVNSAISNLKERGGSSLQAIKKYIASNYKVDVEKLAPFVKKYLKSAVASGSLVQTKGKGASGSFKLSSKDKPAKAVKKPVKAKKPTAEKKAAKPKKAAAKKATKPVEKKRVAKPKKPKTPKKEKKAKAPKKPKTPKPKKAAKKAAPKKK